MSKHFNLNSIVLFLSVISLMSSCKDDDKKNGDATNTATTTDSQKPAVFTVTLDNLYIGRQAFDDLNMGSKLVFSHIIVANNKINLNGWLLRPGDKFDLSPDMKLANGNASGISLNGDIYFGNVVLSPSNFNKIKTALTNQNMKYVLFLPKIVDNSHIGYDISVSPNQSMVAGEALATAEANPSPPKDY